MAEPIQLPPPSSRPDVLIIAGEHSGDQHAAAMVKGLLSQRPELSVCAFGGDCLKAAGAQVIFDLLDHSVVGFAEVMKHYGFFKELFAATAKWIAEHRPRAVCFVDYPGFNLRLAERLLKDGLALKGGGDIKLLYYISPQIWAWKGHRRFKMAKLLDALAVIFPFEVECYADTDLSVSFVGHPFVADDFQLGIRYAPDGPVLLLPGSRVAPVRRIFPVLVDAFYAFEQSHTDCQAVALYPSERVRAELEGILAQRSDKPSKITLMPAESPVNASAVLTSSGTMSLKVALASIPGRIVYRAHPWTYLLGRLFVKIPYLGIANILLQRPAYPEYLQGAAQPSKLADELAKILEGGGEASTSAANASELRALLGEGQNNTAADWLATELER